MLLLSLLFLFGASIFQHAQAKTIGAVYTATNVNTLNAVQVYAVDETGALTYSNTVATGGLGSSSTGADSLFSQDSIAVHGNYLFVVNAGSNSLSLFGISPSNPLSISFIANASTAGSLGLQFPIAVSVHPVQPIACVLSGGAINGITCFTYDANTLAPITGLAVSFNQQGLTTPPAGPRNTFSDLSWTDDGSALIVSYKGFSAASPGFVLSYPVTGATAATSTFGALLNSTIPNSAGPFSITPIRTVGTGATAGNSFFVTDPLGTSIDTFSIIKSTGVVTGVNSTVIPTAGICWSEVSPSTNSYVAVGRGFSQLTFSDSLAVTVTNSVTFPGGNGGLDSSIATISGVDFLFVLSPGNSSVFVYSLPSASTANYVGSYSLISASIKHQGLATYIIAPAKLIGAVYTATNLNTANAVQVYALDETGALTYSTVVATGGLGSSSTGGDSLFSQDSIAVHGNYLFVVNAGSNSLSLFSISPSNPLSISLIANASTAGSLGLQFPIAVSVHPVQPIACALSGGAINGITCFTYDANALTPITGLAVSFNQQGLSTPPAGPRNTFSDLTWTDDGSALIVSYKGFSAAAPGFILSYRVTGATAATSTFGAQLNSTIPNSAGPFSITPIRTFGSGATAGNSFFVTDPLGTSIDTFSIVKSTGVVTGVNSTVIPTAGICWSEVSPRTNSYVAVGRGFSQFTFSDSLAVTVTNSVTFPGGNGGLDSTIATINGTDFLFVLSPGNSSVFVYSLPSASSANYIGSYPLTAPSLKHQGLASYIITQTPSTPTTAAPTTAAPTTAAPTTAAPSSSSSSSTGMSRSSSSSSSSSAAGPNSNGDSRVTVSVSSMFVVCIGVFMSWVWA